MDASEIFLWRYYLSTEPHGELRQDYHSATICQAIYSILNAFSKSPKSIPLEKCLLKFEESDELALKRKQLTAIVSISAALGGKKKLHKKIIEDLRNSINGVSDNSIDISPS